MDSTSTHSASLLEKTYNLIAEFDQRKKERDVTCAPLGVQAYQLAKQSGDKSCMAKAVTTLTHFYTDITSEFDKAIDYLKEAIEIFDDKADAEAKAEFFRRLGLNYDYLGDLIQSKQAYDDSVRLLENRSDLSETAFLTLARSLFNESIIYGDLGLETLKKEYLHRAFGYFQKANYRPGIARCYISFGVDAFDKKECELALTFYGKAIALAEEINDLPPYCVAMGNSGIVYADMGQKEQAVVCTEKSIARVKNQTNKHFELSIYKMAGRVYQVVKDFEKSDYWFSEAHKIHTQMGKVVDHFELFKFWAETLSSLGRHEEAYQKLVVFMEQKEELHKLNKEAELNDATLRFQYEEGKKEQELLRKKNAEIAEYTNKLEMSNYELNQFAHVASHDMKEPLRMISNYSQLLERNLSSELSDVNKEYLFYINDGARRMMNVIQSLLQLSKINATQKKTNIDMEEVLDEVKRALKFNIEEKQAIIRSGELPTIFGDRVHIVQLIQNLVGNAIKYNKNKGAMVEISCTNQGANYQFEIADNGIGIAPQYREKVFIIFQRLHSRYEYEGTGIGLAICKKIVDSLGGKIWIEDSPLGGTKFCFTIPK